VTGVHEKEGAKIRLANPALGADELAAVAEVLADGMLTMGPRVVAFEEGLAEACEVRHAVAVSSGTAALHLAVLALGLEPGDEVLVPAYTFPATASVVALAGLRPVLVDVDPETMDLDPLRVEVHRLRIDVDEHRPQAGERDDVRRGRERVRGYEYQIGRAHV